MDAIAKLGDDALGKVGANSEGEELDLVGVVDLGKGLLEGLFVIL